MNITPYRTDISNWGEVGNLKLDGNKILKTGTLEQILDYVELFRESSIALFIVKTSHVSDKKPGAWYIKGTRNKTVPYEIIKHKCDENTQNKKWASRESYLIQFI